MDPLPELHFWEINLESGEVYRPMSFAEGDGKEAYKKNGRKRKKLQRKMEGKIIKYSQKNATWVGTAV